MNTSSDAATGALFVFISTFFYFRENSIDSNLEHVFYHSRKQNFQQLWWFFNARICIHFNKPHVKVLIEYKVIAEKFEAVFPSKRIDLFPDCIHAFDDKLFHLRDKVVIDTYSWVWVLQIKHFLHSLETQLVAIFELSIMLWKLLHSIVCEMNVLIVNILQIYWKLGWWSTQIALFEEI